MQKKCNFLSEKNYEGKYKHKQIIQALKCFKTNMKYLFTHQKYSEQNIPNTTNHVDGGVNTKLKDLVRRHRGMRIDRKDKLLINLKRGGGG